MSNEIQSRVTKENSQAEKTDRIEALNHKMAIAKQYFDLLQSFNQNIAPQEAQELFGQLLEETKKGFPQEVVANLEKVISFDQNLSNQNRYDQRAYDIQKETLIALDYDLEFLYRLTSFAKDLTTKHEKVISLRDCEKSTILEECLKIVKINKAIIEKINPLLKNCEIDFGYANINLYVAEEFFDQIGFKKMEGIHIRTSPFNLIIKSKFQRIILEHEKRHNYFEFLEEENNWLNIFSKLVCVKNPKEDLGFYLHYFTEQIFNLLQPEFIAEPQRFLLFSEQAKIDKNVLEEITSYELLEKLTRISKKTNSPEKRDFYIELRKKTETDFIRIALVLKEAFFIAGYLGAKASENLNLLVLFLKPSQYEFMLKYLKHTYGAEAEKAKTHYDQIEQIRKNIQNSEEKALAFKKFYNDNKQEFYKINWMEKYLQFWIKNT